MYIVVIMNPTEGGCSKDNIKASTMYQIKNKPQLAFMVPEDTMQASKEGGNQQFSNDACEPHPGW